MKLANWKNADAKMRVNCLVAASSNAGKNLFEHHFSCPEIALAILEFLFRAKREVEIAARRKALQVVGGGRGSDKKERESRKESPEFT